MKIFVLFLFVGCSSTYVIKGRNTQGNMDFDPVRSSFMKRVELKRWSYMWGTTSGDIILPDDLGKKNVDMSHMKIESTFSGTDVLTGFIPFMQRRTFQILGISHQDD